MSINNFEKILNNILETKKTAVIVFDVNLNILYISDMAKKIAEKSSIKSISDYFDVYDVNEYRKIIKSGKCSEKKIKRIDKLFYLSTLSPLKENDVITGLIEIIEVKDESYVLSYELKNIHRKDYETSEYENVINLSNGTVYTLDSIITCDMNMRMIIDKSYKTANSNSPVLIYGETGTGKELFAQGIHNASPSRKNNMFIAQNCAAIPETLLESLLFGTTEGSFTGAKNKPGLFEIAENGTIYLDEINSMDLNLQAKLLRVIQENTYMPIGAKTVKRANVRIIASFNEDPISVIKKGKFRRDLYYRLNVIYIKIPSLHERREDIRLLTNHFISVYNKKFHKNVAGIDEDALKILENYRWEGNVRELKNNIERIMNFIDNDFVRIEDISNFIIKEAIEKDEENLLHDVTANDGGCVKNKEYCCIDSEPEISVTGKTFREVVETTEINIIKAALNESGGNIALAARKLDLPRQTLKNKIDKYNIKPIF